MNSEHLYDLSELRDMSDNDEAFVREMMQVFVTNNSEYLDELKLALEAKDWQQVKFFAHKIKPSILLFKIESLKQTILNLNTYSGNQENLEAIPNLVKEVDERLNLVFHRINEELSKN